MAKGQGKGRTSRSPSAARAPPRDSMSDGTSTTPSGVCFPLSGAKRSTTGPAKAILAASLDAGDHAAAEALRASKDKDWRFGYVDPLKICVAAMASDADTCEAMAMAGLDAAHDIFEFGRDGVCMPLRTAMDGTTFSGSLETGTVKGTGERGGELVVPFGGVDYSGPELIGEPAASSACAACCPLQPLSIRSGHHAGAAPQTRCAPRPRRALWTSPSPPPSQNYRRIRRGWTSRASISS